MKKLVKRGVVIDQASNRTNERRWMRNTQLAAYLGVSKMYLWRLKHGPDAAALNFPKAAMINGIEFNDVGLVDAWFEARIDA
jgi:hypothetical protein